MHRSQLQGPLLPFTFQPIIIEFNDNATVIFSQVTAPKELIFHRDINNVQTNIRISIML